MKTKENNKLIAEFMGRELGYEYMVLEKNKWIMPKYHLSWDWLMSVVDKIEGLGFEVRIEGISCKINRILEKDSLIVSWVCGDKKGKIGLVHTSVLSFIEWYNNK